MKRTRPIVAITDHIFPNLEPETAILATIGADVRVGQCRTEEEVIELVRSADGIINCYAPVTRRVIDELDQCLVISRYGIGLDSVDLDAASQAGIIVTNVPDYCLDEVSDHTLALLLALHRDLCCRNQDIRRGQWVSQTRKPVHRLRGEVLGLLGFGKIAQAVVPKAQALGLRIIATDPYVSSETAAEYGVKLVSFEELLRGADVISIHARLTLETQCLFNENVLRSMKPTAFLINTSRGKIVQEAALVEAIKKGWIAGAGLDVLETEPPSPDNPLLKMDEVILTPHMAYYSEESQVELQTKAALEVARVLKGEQPHNWVNRAAITKVRTSFQQ